MPKKTFCPGKHFSLVFLFTAVIIMIAATVVFVWQGDYLATKIQFKGSKSVSTGTSQTSQSGTQRSRAAEIKSDDASQFCTVDNEMGEYIESYLINPPEYQTYEYKTPGDVESLRDHVWYAQMQNNLQTQWNQEAYENLPDEAMYVHGSVGDTPDILYGLALGSTYGYTGQFWRGHGVWDDATGTYHLEGIENTPSCAHYLFVINYNPRVIDIIGASGIREYKTEVAWMKEGQIAFYSPELNYCAGHCAPQDAAALPHFVLKFRVIGEPDNFTSGDVYRPFSLEIINAENKWFSPDTMDGNQVYEKLRLTDETFSDWGWYMQKAPQLFTDEGTSLSSATYPSTRDLITELSRTASAYTDLDGYQLFLGKFAGFLFDDREDKKELYFINSNNVGFKGQGVSVYDLLVPTDAIINQNFGRGQILQGIIGVPLTKRLQAFINEPPNLWPQITGINKKTDGFSVPIPYGDETYENNFPVMKGKGAMSVKVDPIKNSEIEMINGYIFAKDSLSAGNIMFAKPMSIINAFFDATTKSGSTYNVLKKWYKKTIDLLITTGYFYETF